MTNLKDYLNDLIFETRKSEIECEQERLNAQRDGKKFNKDKWWEGRTADLLSEYTDAIVKRLIGY